MSDSPFQATLFQKVVGGIVVALILLYFYSSRRQEDKWKVLEKGLQESFGESPSPATDSPVYAIDVEGDASYKRASWLNWWPLKAGVELHPGDLVFVSDASQAVLFFLDQDSLVTLPEGTLFHVGLTVPQMSKLRTSGGVSSELGDGAEGLMTEGKNNAAKFSTRVIQNPSLKKAGSKEGDDSGLVTSVVTDEDLKIVRNTRSMPVRYPGEFVELYVTSFPTSIPITFDQLPAMGKLWGYLWSGKELEPQWSSVAYAGFPRVPIDKPGTFVFQAMSDDELYASPPVVIKAMKREQADFLPRDGKWLEGVRIFQ